MNKIEINPFLEELIIDAGKEVIDFYEYMKNKNKYDKEGKTPTIHLERSDKIFIYTNPTIRSIINKLSGSASKLLLWIQQSTFYGKDYIKFNSKRFMKETKMSAPTLIRAKNELIDNHIIAVMKDKTKYYWINPAIMFKGNRVKKYPNNIVIFKRNSNGVTSNSRIN